MRKFGKKLLAVVLSAALLVSGNAAYGAADGTEAQAAAVHNTRQISRKSGAGMASLKGSDGTADRPAGGNVLSSALAREQARQEQDYFVSDIQVDAASSQAEVTFQTTKDAELIAAVYTEDGQELKASGYQKVSYEDTKAVLKLTGDLPEYFLVKAFLVDAVDHTPLADPYVSQLYTQEMQKMLSSTVNDYDSDRVVNFDSDKKTNFVVYNDDVVAAEETKTDNIIEKRSDGSYVIENASAEVKNLKSGDIFSCESQEGNLIVVSVDSVKTNGDEVTLTDKGGSSLGLDDVFDVVKIESDGSEDELSVDNSGMDENLVYEGIVDESGNTLKRKNSTKKVDVNTSVSKSLKYSIDAEKGIESKDESKKLSGKISGSLSFGVTASIRVYVSHSYQFVSLIVEYALTPDVQVPGEFSWEFWLGQITITTPAPGVVLGYRPCIPLTFGGAIDFEGKIYGTLGGAYDSDTGMVNKCIYPKLAGSIEADVSASIGVRGRLVLAIIQEELASVQLDKSLLLNITGTNTFVTSSTVSIHDCKACLCGEVNVEFNCVMSANIGKLEKEKTLIDIRLKLLDWYRSFTHNEFAFTKCPHIRYNVTVRVTDPDGKAVKDAVIEGTGLDKDPVTDAKGSASFYLAPGTYALVAKATDLQGRSDIQVKDEVKNVKIPMAQNKDITGKLELYGDAERQTDGSVHLTELETWQSGSAWYSLPIDTTKGFEAAFSYYAGEGRDDYYGGADGIVLNFSSETGIGAQGGAMGFAGEYGVELDSYPQNSGDPEGKHIAIIHRKASDHIVSRQDDRVDDSTWHNVVVKYKDGTMQVYLDGSRVLERSGVQLENEVYVGLTAATGSGKNKHYVKNFNITVNSRDISVLGKKQNRLNSKKAAETITTDGYTGEVQRDDKKVTAVFSGLKAGTKYLIVEAENVAADDIFAADNLLYIDQGTSDADGKLSFTYIPKTSDYSDIRLYGEMKTGSDDENPADPGDNDNSGDAGDNGNTDPGNSGNTGNNGNAGDNSNSGNSADNGNTGSNTGNSSSNSKPKKKPAKVTGVRAKSKKKQILVSWKKAAASGYQVQYCTSRKFKKAKAVFTGKSTKVTLKKGLKKKKTYFVRVRAFNKYGNAKKYGSFSAVKKVKIR